MRTKRSGESALLLLDVVDLLTGEKVAYAVIGAMAASVRGGKALKFIGREDFIAMKVFGGGPMDLIDAARALHGNYRGGNGNGGCCPAI